MGNIPDKRRVTQFRIAWDDYDQLDYEDDYDEHEAMVDEVEDPLEMARQGKDTK